MQQLQAHVAVSQHPPSEIAKFTATLSRCNQNATGWPKGTVGIVMSAGRADIVDDA
jgi:hypothetical protein